MQNIFVFGSNLAGRHGRGSALEAIRYHGAVYGIGLGLQGNSYAIPTKNNQLKSLSLKIIKRYIDDFILFAISHPELQFNVVSIGCGLAGYTPEQIAPFFRDSPENCKLSNEFQEILKERSWNQLTAAREF